MFGTPQTLQGKAALVDKLTQPGGLSKVSRPEIEAQSGARPAFSRRQFLRASCCAAAAVSSGTPFTLLAEPPAERPGTRAARIQNQRPDVFRVTSAKLVSGRIAQPLLLRKALEVGLCGLTKEHDVRDAWRHILKPDDVVLIKFNQSAASLIGTSPLVAHELVDSLIAAGWPPSQIMLLEAENPKGLKLRRPDLRWQADQVEFGSSGRDAFVAALAEATAIINVPFLKTHHLATMTCCLKNLSHGLIGHPARFHANGCDPAIAEIAGSAPIRSKLRLNLVDALRPVFDRGPGASESDIHPLGSLLFGYDAVACDSVAYGILNATRSLRGIGPLLPGAAVPAQLVSAARMGLGIADQEHIGLTCLDL